MQLCGGGAALSDFSAAVTATKVTVRGCVASRSMHHSSAMHAPTYTQQPYFRYFPGSVVEHKNFKLIKMLPLIYALAGFTYGKSFCILCAAVFFVVLLGAFNFVFMFLCIYV